MLENVMPYVYGGIALLSVLCFGAVIWLGRSLNANEAPAPQPALKKEQDNTEINAGKSTSH